MYPSETNIPESDYSRAIGAGMNPLTFVKLRSLAEDFYLDEHLGEARRHDRTYTVVLSPLLSERVLVGFIWSKLLCGPQLLYITHASRFALRNIRQTYEFLGQGTV